MNPTPTQAETPTPRTDAAIVRSKIMDDGGEGLYPEWTGEYDESISIDFTRTLERELATAQRSIVELEAENAELRKAYDISVDNALTSIAEIHKERTEAESELTTLREKLAEEQAGAASMREALTEISKQKPEKPDYWSSCGQCERNADKASELLESTTSGKATLEELERLRRERDDAVNRADEDRMRNLGFVNKLSELSSGKQSAEKELERLRAEVEKQKRGNLLNYDLFQSAYKAASKLEVERDAALATIAELRARVSQLEGALQAIASSTFPQRSAGGGAHRQMGAMDMCRLAEQALQPTTPTEPEKAETIKCPDCGKPCGEDHNSFKCDDCRKLWPKGHGHETAWIEKAGSAEPQSQLHARWTCRSCGFTLVSSPACDAAYAQANHDKARAFLEGRCKTLVQPVTSAEPQPATVPLALAETGGDFYNGMEWFACWLLDNAEQEIITEEKLRPWAAEALAAHRANHPKP